MATALRRDQEKENEQLRRLRAAGWDCAWQLTTEIRIGHGDIRQFTVSAEKGAEKIVVVSDRADESKAWENLYLEAKRADPDLGDNGKK
jgi:hypothetical protein